MRASTLLALTVAIMLGIGVAVAARISGLFRQPEASPPPEVKVLVAGQNIFAGGLIDPTFVQVRNMTPQELEHYREHQEEYLPATASAVALRIASENIPTDQPILKKHLKPMELPESLNSRLLPSMRAISVSVPKDRAAGGPIRVGDWVDVLLKSEVRYPGGERKVHTAVIAPRVRIVAKRNTLWPVFAPLPKDKPISFTLELNTYRAALLEFAKSSGDLTLMPLPLSEQRQLESTRTALLKKGSDIKQVHFIQPGSQEAITEEERVTNYNRKLVISEKDLISIFGLKEVAKPTPPPPEKRIRIQQVVRTSIMEDAVFTLEGNRIQPERSKQNSSANLPAPSLQQKTGFEFSVADCPSCEENVLNRQSAVRRAASAANQR